ncbi:hypothetical protein [Saccharopolyspora sp. NPDC002376]
MVGSHVTTEAVQRGHPDSDGASRISVEDLAVAVLDELENPGDAKHFTVG